ncbi:MAG: hypothetical protein MUE66_01220 [Acidimicrobiia bacterium]|nr:hypothetical protein [Acidimicrobiia bacterium]
MAWNDTADQFLVVWEDTRDWSRGQDIYGRLVNAAGSPLGSDALICGANATKYDYSPAVAWNTTRNEYLVVWQDYRNQLTSGSDIYGRRVNAAGVPQGADFRISGSGATGNESTPAIAWNSVRNQYLVVWADDRAWTSAVHGRRLRADGARLGEDFLIPASAWHHALAPAVVYNATRNEYFVVWEDWRNVFDIYGRRVRASGSPVGTDLRISAAGAEAFNPALAWDGVNNRYLVVWEDSRDEAGRGLDVYGARANGKATAVGIERRYSGSGAVKDDVDAAVAFSAASNRYLVVWEDHRNFAQNETEIFGRRVAASGIASGDNFRVSDAGATIDKEGPALAWNDDADQYLAVWGDNRDFATTFWDIYGRLVGG